MNIQRDSLDAITLPDSSRVWMFGAQRLMSEEEIQHLNHSLADFVSSWQAHGNLLTADYCILHRCVIVVAVDELQEAPSGCSIDKVFHLLQSQKEKYDLDFFQRTLVWLIHENDLCILNRQEVQAGIDSGEIHPNSLAIHMLANRLGDLKNGGIALPLSESWIAPKLKFIHER